MIKKSRITCKCHGVSGSCSLITCWQQLTSIREIGKRQNTAHILQRRKSFIHIFFSTTIFHSIVTGDHLREKYDEATQVKLNKRGRLQVKDPRYKVPTATDLVYLDESPDWCRNSRQLQWPGKSIAVRFSIVSVKFSNVLICPFSQARITACAIKRRPVWMVAQYCAAAVATTPRKSL